MKYLLPMLLAACSCATATPVRFSPVRTRGPFFCFNDKQGPGIVCLDYVAFIAYMSQHPEEFGPPTPPQDTPEIPSQEQPSTDL